MYYLDLATLKVREIKILVVYRDTNLLHKVFSILNEGELEENREGQKAGVSSHSKPSFYWYDGFGWTTKEWRERQDYRSQARLIKKCTRKHDFQKLPPECSL